MTKRTELGINRSFEILETLQKYGSMERSYLDEYLGYDCSKYLSALIRKGQVTKEWSGKRQSNGNKINIYTFASMEEQKTYSNKMENTKTDFDIEEIHGYVRGSEKIRIHLMDRSKRLKSVDNLNPNKDFGIQSYYSMVWPE
jgi:hypothetical protein